MNTILIGARRTKMDAEEVCRRTQSDPRWEGWKIVITEEGRWKKNGRYGKATYYSVIAIEGRV